MKKILIVDDYADLTHVMQIFLQKEGFIVETCNKADEVFSKVYSFFSDLIILDVFLDNESGKSLCQKIKGMESTSHIPIILYSAHQCPVDYLADACHDDYIQNPFEIKDILHKIKLHLALNSAGN